MTSRFVVCVIFISFARTALFSETKLPLTPRACTEIRYLASEEITDRPVLQLSPNSKQVAYIVQAPNFGTNQYEDELYVTPLDGTVNPEPKLIMSNALITAITWFPDNRHLAILTRLHNKTVLAQVDSTTGQVDVIREAHTDVTDYSMDSSGNSIAISVRMAASQTRSSRTAAELRNGYRLDLTSIEPPVWPLRQIYLLRRTGSHHWESGSPLSFVSPLSNKMVTSLVDNHSLHFTISPNARYLLIDNVERVTDITTKDTWRTNPSVQYLANRGGIVVPTYLYDLRTHMISMPLESPLVRYQAWSPDSSSFVGVALAPVGSKWEDNDLKEGKPSDHNTHLFSVDIHSGTISEVLQRAERLPLTWVKPNEVAVQDKTGTIHILNIKADKWTEGDSFRIPPSERSPYLPIASDGHRFVMEYENASVPPEILKFDRSETHVDTIAKLNPQADELLLPRMEQITWTTSTGYQARGLLLLPPDYNPNRRYPLVIENGSILYEGQFVCDSGADHVSSFTRGILADSGIVYLMRYWQGNDDWKSNYYPKGYPGEIGEAEFQLDLAESAVQNLDDRRMIDPAMVGLIGFSRGGWYTEYALARSHVKFAAATATDNILYSMGEYWSLYSNSMMHLDEGMYGGPPYGQSLNNWLKYSISFNLDKIHTPLLMEVMGYGHKDDDPDRPYNNLSKHYEEFVGLSRLSKPVEMYYYPLEKHQMDHPVARIAALQRNVDWYRFWLQDYERPNPEDPDQYKRWKHLRELRDTDFKMAEQRPASTPKPN